MPKKEKIQRATQEKSKTSILWWREISMTDLALVGGKNASLGEMYSQLTAKGVRIPNGFAITAAAYREFIQGSGLQKIIKLP